jgi:hydrogenase expression/formation protein HypC
VCLAVPAEVVAIAAGAGTATIDLGGMRREISLALIDEIAVGDFVLVHAGFALARISPGEAARTLALFAEAGFGGDGDTTPAGSA